MQFFSIMKRIFTILFLILILSGCSNNSNIEKQAVINQQKEIVTESKQLPTSNIASAPEKVEVFLFHRTARCSTCIAIGKLAGKTVQEKFSEEVKSGRIVFKEINIDLPENKELAQKFQASGSALFINVIYDRQDHISEDVTVWRLTQNETQFKSYLKDKINNLLAK